MKLLTWQNPEQLFVAQELIKIVNYFAADLTIMKKYIIPEAELASMTSERAFLGGASEIPFGGETGEFDTRAQDSWADDWEE